MIKSNTVTTWFCKCVKPLLHDVGNVLALPDIKDDSCIMQASCSCKSEVRMGFWS